MSKKIGKYGSKNRNLPHNFFNNLKTSKIMNLKLRKTHLTIVFLLAFTAVTTAQDLHFGFQMSPSWSWLGTDNTRVNGVGSALGLKLGLIAENRFSEAYSISSGLGFHFNMGGALRYALPGKLWTSSYDNFDIKPAVTDTFAKDSKLRYSISYFEIPIGLKMRTPETGAHVRWFAEPLLTFGFRTNAKGAISSATPVQDQEKIPIKEEVAGAMLSWGIGAGGEYIISNNTAIVVGLYYQNGFTDVTKDGSSTMYDPSVTGGQRVDNSKGLIKALTLRLGVMF
ncbi:MAG: outer membrane beta-barrel protein [Saprospiraceae bacterium]|nr:outer membrane beta-barrel protein [Saprospiraceae bacterium]